MCIFHLIKKYHLELFFLTLVMAITAILMYPTWLHLRSGIYGIDHPDNLGALYSTWWLQFSLKNNLDPNALWLSAPFGWDKAFVLWQPLWFYVIRFLGIFLDHFTTHNILLFLSFPLSYLFSYRLAYHCSKDKLSSLVAAFIFTFCPYHLARTQEHLSLAHIEFLPLAFLSLLLLVEKPTFKRSVFCGLSFTLVASSDFYYGYFIGLFALFFFIIRVLGRWVTWSEIKGYIIAFATFGVSYGSLCGDYIKTLLIKAPHNEALKVGLYEREFRDLFRFSAKPLSYLLPYVDNPIFGKVSRFFASSPFFGYSDVNYLEQVVFVGFTAIVLAWWGMKFFKKENKVLYFTFMFCGLFFLLTSFSPYWKFETFTIYFPSYFLYKIFPIVRSYGRISIFFQLILMVFVAFGLKRLFQNTAQLKKVMISGISLSFILLEFVNVPPFYFFDLSHVPQVYQWLKKEPGHFIIAEYPLSDELDQHALYYQTIHEKKLFNFCRAGSEACKIASKLKNINDVHTPRYLKGLGVEYIIYRPKEASKSADFLKSNHVEGLQFIGAFDNNDIWVFKIIAQSKNIKDL